MPEYFYQYNFLSEDFERNINNQIPTSDSVSSIKSTFCPIVGVDVPSTSEEDLDEYMASQNFTRVQPATPPTDQIAIGEIQLQIGTGPFGQRITSTDAKANLWNQNTQETDGIITPDQANNELTIDTLFNTNTGDRYDMIVNVGVSIPRNDALILTIIHNDNGSENQVAQAISYGTQNQQAQSMSLTGSFVINSSVNQSAYVNVRTIGAPENINWYSGNAILKRF